MISVPQDKLLHFFAGFTIAVSFGILLHPIIGFLLSAGIAIAKEIYDELRPHGTNFDIPDLAVTLVGAMLGAGLALV